MLISIHDNSLQRVAYMDNLVPNALHYYDDNWRRLLKEATSTLSFSVDKIGHDKEQYLNEDNYVSFKYEGAQYLFSIMRTEETENKIIVYAENLNLELLNEVKKPIDVTTAQNLVWYLNNSYILTGSGLTLGINEVSDLTRKIKLESEQTGLSRITSIANNFDAEIEFVTELNSDGTLKAMIVNFYKKYDGTNQGVGTNRQDVILYYGKNIDGVKRIVDKTDLYNAIEPTGKDGLNIAKLEKTEYDENGEVEYYTPWNVNRIYAPQSKSKYRGQLLNDVDGWLNRPYSTDGTANVNTLYTLALNELKKHAYPAVTYDVTGYFDLNIGDTVRIQDSGFVPALTLQARVAEQSICFSDPTKNKTTFGNILALESRVSQDLTGRLKELVDQVTPYRFEIVSDNGLTFKNSEGNTTLTARVYKGSNVEEVSVDSFEWLIDGVSFGGTSKSQLVNASQVTGTAVVRYNAKIGDTVIGGVEVTLQDVSDGTDGISPTVTVNPDTSLTIVDVQGTSTTPMLKGSDGTDGTSGIIVSSAAPDSPQTGQLWQDTSTTPQLIKKWNGTSWVIWELYVENMNVNNLSALSPNLGTITGGSYESWSSDIDHDSGNVNFNGIYIKNGKNRSLTINYPENTTPDKNTFQGGTYKGTQIGNDGVSYFAISSNHMDTITPHELLTEFDNPYGFWEKINLNSKPSYAGKLFTSYIDGISNGLAFDSPNGLSVIGRLNVSDGISIGSGQITEEALQNKGWKDVTGFVNGVQADAVPLQYKVTINMDNTRTIKFRGGFKGNGTSDIPQASIVQLPLEARPTTTISFPCMGSGARIARIIITTDGWIQFNVASGSSISGFNGVLLSNVFYEI